VTGAVNAGTEGLADDDEAPVVGAGLTAGRQ
jgi:hypothetical protein